jgi:hypothetical protein
MILAFFAACKPSDNENGESGGNGNGSSTGGSTATGFVYLPTYTTFTGEVNELNGAKLIDDVIYFSQNIVVGKQEVQYPDPDGGGEIDAGPMPIPRDEPIGTLHPIVIYDEDGNVAVEEDTDGNVTIDEPPEDDGTYYEDIFEMRLFRVNPDATGLTQLPDYAPPPLPDTAQPGASYYLQQLIPAENDALWVLETGWFGYQDENDSWIEDQRTHLRKISSDTGKELADIDMSTAFGNSKTVYINNIASDDEGNFTAFVYDYNENTNVVYAFAPDGSQLFDCTIDQSHGYISQLFTSDGKITVVLNTDNGDLQVRYLDFEAKKLSDSVGTLPFNTYNIIGTAADNGGFMSSDETGLFVCKPNDKERVELLNWLDADVDGTAFQTLGVLSNGDILGYTRDWSVVNSAGNPKTEFVTIKKTPASEAPQRTVLTLACNYLDWNLRREILEFNKRDTEYRIKVKDYNKYNSPDNNWSGGITKLNTEIISGNTPDIIQTGGLPFGIYASRGLFEDLYPFINADPEFGENTVVPAFAKALEDKDGQLIQIAPWFSVLTMIGSSDYVGEKSGWTMQELMDRLNEAKKNDSNARAFAYYYSRSDVMQQVFYYNLRAYANFETGEVSFNSPDFIQLIEFAKTFPESFDWNDGSYNYTDERYDISKGVQLVQLTGINRFDDYMLNEAIFEGKLAFKGFPCETSDGSVFQAQLGLAMGKQSEHKDGAWKFMRLVLTEEFENTNIWSFPANNKLFEEQLKTAMTPQTAKGFRDYYGYDYGTDPNSYLVDNYEPGKSAALDSKYAALTENPPTTSAPDELERIPKGTVYLQDDKAKDNGGISLPYYELTAEQRDKFMAFFNSVTHLDTQDTKLVEIVNEELAPFFADQKSADATVTVIQSRAKIYVNEQR